MKKILFVLALTLMIYPLYATAEEYPVLDRQVEIRQAHLKWVARIVEISMEAAIDYIDEISGGAGTSKLSSLLDDFRDQNEKAGTLTTHVALNNAIRQLTQITNDFNEETQKQMREYNGKNLLLLGRIATALNDNKNGLDKLKEDYWNIKKENVLGIFDIYVDFAQDILDKLGENGYDITEAQKKLDEIKDKRGEVEDALEKEDDIKLFGIYVELVDLSKELGEIIKDLQVEVPQKTIVKYWITVGERAVDRTYTIISELDTLGIDVKELKEIHSKAETDLKKAQDAFDAGNLGEAVEALEDLKTDLIELREAYDELISGGELPEDMESKVKSTTDALDDIIEEMDNSL